MARKPKNIVENKPKKPRLKNLPNKPKYPNKPPVSAGVKRIENWKQRVEAKKAKYQDKVDAIKKHNAKLMAEYNREMKDYEKTQEYKRSLLNK